MYHIHLTLGYFYLQASALQVHIVSRVLLIMYNGEVGNFVMVKKLICAVFYL